MRLLTRASLRYLTQHRLQLLLSVLGVALGVAVVLSIDLAIQSARTGFRISAETVSGRATHVLASDVGFVDEGLLASLRIDLDVPAAAPVVEGYATSARLPGRALRILGIDPFSEGPFRPYVAGGPTGVDVSRLITTRRGVALSSGLASSGGLTPGDSLAVTVEGQAWTLPVVEVIEPGDELARAGLADVLLMDIAGAQEVLRMTGRLSRIDLRLEDDAEGAARVAAVESALPGGVGLQSVGTRSETMSGMIAAFDVNLTALSLLALIFGMFLIYNAVTFSVVQRRQILGRLRALGVTRGEIVRMILSEALWIGALGAVLGTVAGLFLARGLVGMVARTINDLYFAVSVQGIDLEPLLLVKGWVLGIGATLLAALPPALEAAGANPRMAALRSVVESRARRLVPRAAAWGAVLCLVGAGLLLIPTRSLAVSFTALFFVITGLAFATPAGTLVLVGAVRPILGRLAGTLGLIAARGVGTSLSRTAPAIAALVVAVSVTVGLGVMIQSFRGTLVQWLDGTLRADVYVSLPGPGASRATGTLWPDLVDDFVAHPQVSGYSTYRGIDLIREGDAFRLVALELDPRGESAFDFLDGAREEIMSRFRAGEGVIASEPYVFSRGLEVGDAVTLTTDQGERALPIVGVFYDYGSEQGTVMMARSLYDRLFDDPGITSLGLFLEDEANSDVVVGELLSIVPDGRAVIARTNDSLRSASLEVFDRTFQVTAVLRLLAFVVAFVGVLSALAALQLERARELGLLRASGMTPGQLGRLVVTQTGLIGLAAGVLAVPMGLALSVVMIFVVNKRSFGWTLNMEVGPEVLLQAVGLALVGALLAGVYPAWKMARTSPALALRGE
ncbi:MAG: FtsX-like permease family protein [Gemmatimonadetes bacterium]|nr:FtsX-like permease family protein [Gemmatimonadota bacterium]NNL31134.1 FtsX-like permease family protein [Gemmatimonadota bacterium]